jgi:hypothetical protein
VLRRQHMDSEAVVELYGLMPIDLADLLARINPAL